VVFLSEILGAEVIDVEQRRAGRVRDVAVATAEPYPVVTGVLLNPRRGLMVPWSNVRTIAGREIALRARRDDLPLQPVPDQDIWLARDVLDKQVIDTDGRRLVRVNDLQLVESAGRMLLVGADIGTRGLLRRLGIEHVGKSLVRLVSRRDLPMVLVSWDVVQPLREESADAVRLRVSQKKIGKLHPADIADIVEELSAKERSAIFESLTDEVAADTLEEMETDDQVSVIEHMEPERASEILEEMHPDEAADILADLPEERAREILGLMESDEAEEVRELLSFPDDTAGGLMTTEYVAVSLGLTAQECIDALRVLEPEAEHVYYVYVVDQEEHLHGVLSLRDLIVAKPETPIRDFIRREIVTVRVDATRDEVAAVMSKYNLLALPVLDAEGRLRGIVTVDDALDVMLPEGVKRRLPKVV
jgi:CBS domain-containing protein/sporulation protein YlmC with PRC-barrel domain